MQVIRTRMVEGIQVALVLALAGLAWGATLGVVMVVAGPLRGHGSLASALLGGVIGGGILGGGLAVVMHTFLGRILRWIGTHIPFAWVAIALFITIPYYLFAWPGVKIAEWRGLIRFADTPAPAPREPATPGAPDAREAQIGACPYAGKVVAEQDTTIMGFASSKMGDVFIITADWRVRTPHKHEFGYISRDGSIYEGTSGFGGHNPEQAAKGPGFTVSAVAQVRNGTCYTASNQEIGPLWS